MSIKAIIESLSLVGGMIGIAGYLPQVTKLLKEKKSLGVSSLAWYAFLLSNIILLYYAIYIKDIVFTTLQTLSVIFCITIIILVYKYKK
jgi:uncharacterized protein with PQ loop repeat